MRLPRRAVLAAGLRRDLPHALLRTCGYLRCDVCGGYERGWRTLGKHADREHPGETP